MAQASISSIIDRSTSMRSYAYLEPAKTDAATFVTIMHSGDQIGLVALDHNSPVIYNLATIDSSHNAITAALNVISGITAQGDTNMNTAIVNAHSMLSGASNPAKAIILLSDGEWNSGSDPLASLATDIPIYTIALGPSAGTNTLQTIASRTNGKYYYSPDAFDLAAIYNQITNDANVAKASLNKRQTIPSYNFTSFPLPVPANTSHVSLGANWLDKTINYTAGTPGTNQVNVMIRDPSGTKVSMAPTFLGDEYAAFHIHNPAAGTWTVGCWCGQVPNNQFKGTIGGFEPNSTLSLHLETDRYTANKGQPMNASARLDTGGEELTHLTATAHLDAPRTTRTDLLSTYAKDLAAIDITSLPKNDRISDESALLLQLQQKLLPERDIFARSYTPVECLTQITQDGPILTLPPLHTEIAGEHSIVLEVQGRLASCGSIFSRVQRLSFSVAE